MRNLILAVFLALTFTTAKSQSFIPAYFIIQKNAQFAVLFPSYPDVLNTKGGLFKSKNYSELSMAAGEVVLAWDYKDNQLFCFDPVGRMVIFKDTTYLKRAPLTRTNYVGSIQQKIEMLEGSDINEGSYVWITGQNVAANTITIFVDGDRTIDIPRNNIKLITRVLMDGAKELYFKTVTTN